MPINMSKMQICSTICKKYANKYANKYVIKYAEYVSKYEKYVISIGNDMCCQKYAKYAIKYAEYEKNVILKKICRICTPHFSDVLRRGQFSLSPVTVTVQAPPAGPTVRAWACGPASGRPKLHRLGLSGDTRHRAWRSDSESAGSAR